jgi:4-amino-4-deoxy-L-arabinose transferase-like glycosyltransferase
MSPDAPLPRFALVLLVTALALMWFAGLETRTLLHPDEGRYAEIPREMAATGDWLTPRLNGLKYFEKPPLQYWMTAAAYEALGVTQWTARLWTAISTLLAILFFGYAAWRLGGATFGLYAAAALAGCVGYIVNSHLLTLDGGLCAFLIVAFGAFLIAQRPESTVRECRGWMWMAWAAMAGATLSKGLIGIVIPAATLVFYTLATRDFGLWRRLHLVTGALLFLLLAAPWFVAVSRANPEFFDFFFIHEHFTRYTTMAHGRREPWWYFIPLLLVGMLPWIGLLVWAAPRLWRDGAPAANGFSWQRFALVWSAFVFLFFSASGSKLPSYILPMYPPLCLLAAWLLRDIDPRWLARLTLPAAVLVVLATVVVALGYEPVARRLVVETVSLEPTLRFAPWVTAALAITATGTVAAYVGLRKSATHGRTIAVLALALSVLAAIQVGMIGYDNFRATRSSRDLLRAAEAAHGPFAADVPFYHVHMHDQTVPFYLRRTTTFVSFRDEFALGQDAEPDRSIATDAEWVPIWERLAQGYAMMPPNDYERFTARGVPMRVLARDGRRVIVSRR